jgi:hypothetical protein
LFIHNRVSRRPLFLCLFLPANAFMPESNIQRERGFVSPKNGMHGYLENGTLFARVDAANRLQMEPEVCPGPTIPQ